MARRKKDSTDELLDLLVESPWWVSILVGFVVFFLMRFVGALFASDPMAGPLAVVLSQYAWLSVLFVVPAFVSFLRSSRKRKQLDRQNSIESIRDLTWKQFEELLGEAYRREGFTVIENPGKGPDGGIDLTLRDGTDTYLVQCKQWRTYKVGVKVVREMLGLVTAHGAAGAIVVTSGVFTKEAWEFAANQPVELVDGDELVELIGGAQTSRSMAVTNPAPRRVCPQCGGDLVLRQARRGSHAGSTFWGCSNFPNCRHIDSSPS